MSACDFPSVLAICVALPLSTLAVTGARLAAGPVRDTERGTGRGPLLESPHFGTQRPRSAGSSGFPPPACAGAGCAGMTAEGGYRRVPG